jgi:D-amino-acid dehydrogenase
MRNAAPEKVEMIADSLAMLLDSSVQEHQRLAAGTRAQSWVRPAPYIYVYKNEAAFVEDAYTWKLRRDRGVTYRELRDGEVQALVPSLSAEFRFALALDNHGYIADPMGLVQALAEHFQHSGGSILQRDVTDFDLGEKGPTRMITDDGALDLDILVIAAGAWSGKLTSRLGDPVPLESERGLNVTIRNSGVELCGPVMATFGKFVATPMLPGLRLAGLVEFGGLSGPPNYSRARSLLGHAKRMFPGIDVSEFTEWMGHRPSLPDSLPVIGPSSGFPNVFYAFGHQHVGLTSGPKTGRLVADLVSGCRPNIDLSVFRVDRF